MTKRDYVERFWEKVDKRGPHACWNWLAYKDPKGYGRMGMGSVLVRAHRISWEIRYGPIPKGMNVLHKCDNPPCVNPVHLFLGTQDDNVRDMMEKGRGRKRGIKGEQHWGARLTEADVLRIRAEVAGGRRHGDVALEYTVSRSQVSNITRRKRWKHVK